MVLVTEHIFTRYCMLEVLYSGHYAYVQVKGISSLYSLRKELNGLSTIGTVISEPGKTDLTVSGKIVYNSLTDLCRVVTIKIMQFLCPMIITVT